MKESTVVRLPSPEGVEDALTEVLRRGARELILHVVEAEVAAQLELYEDHRLSDGRRRLVRHGHGPEREIVTGSGRFRCVGRRCGTGARARRTGSGSTRRSCRSRPRADRRAARSLYAPRLVELLEVEPELPRGAEEAPQPQRRFAGNRALAVENLADVVHRDLDPSCQFRRAHPERVKVLAQRLARMDLVAHDGPPSHWWSTTSARPAIRHGFQ